MKGGELERVLEIRIRKNVTQRLEAPGVIAAAEYFPPCKLNCRPVKKKL